MNTIVNLVLLFFAYSFLGWVMEVTLKYIQFHRFINRGFFTGPLLPIYGSGALLITLAIGDMARFESAYGTTFLVSFFLCGAIEYLSSYFMEKRFHARWWDYSQKPMNLHGRIWIGNLLLFGLGGIAIVHIINPLLYRLMDGLGLTARLWLAGGLLAVFAADYVITHFVLKLIKTNVERSEADNTEQINREVRLLLSDRSYFYRRFADAYPDVIYRTERISARMAQIKAETERLRREAEARIESGREQLAASLEPAGAIKNAVIERQTELIDMLYSENRATEAMRKLKKEIDNNLNRLRNRRP